MTRLMRNGEVMATLDEVWTSGNGALAQVLNNLLSEATRSGASPDLELTLAQAAADALGPSWSAETDDPAPFDPGVVY